MKLFYKLLEFDRDWSYALRVAEKPGTARNLAMFFAHSGDSWFWGAGMIALWAMSDVFWKRWAVYELFWISCLAVLVLALKFSIRRKRPEGEWGAIYRNTDPHSFPSGHAARAFLIAMLAGLLGPGWFSVVLWFWAPLVSVARVSMGVHYLSDVIAGAVLGIGVAFLGWQISPLVFPQLSQFIETLTGLALW